MYKTLIIIPSRLAANRLPNKPLLEINKIPMVMHVYNKAKKANIGEVCVATPDQEIFDLVKKFGGKSILTSKDHLSGTDRVFEAYKKMNNQEIEIVINLQGDMPNIQSENIKTLYELMIKNKKGIGTLASKIHNKKELDNINIVKVKTSDPLNTKNFLKSLDFFREGKIEGKNIYHHVGIYAFQVNYLNKYVKLERSINEKKKSLEQMRALDNNLDIHVALISSIPLSVDTPEDLVEIKKLMKYNI